MGMGRGKDEDGDGDTAGEQTPKRTSDEAITDSNDPNADTGTDDDAELRNYPSQRGTA